MTNEELATAIQGGERERLPELWEQVERFVSMQAGKVSRATGGRIDAEDLSQSGFLALVAAAESYDAGAGMSFVGWLAYHLKTAFAEAGGYRTKRQMQDPIHSATSLDVPISEDEGGATLGDVQPDPKAEQAFADAEEAIFNQQLHDVLERALHTLPEDQAEVIRGRYYQGRSLKELGPGARDLEMHGLRHLRRQRITKELRQYIEIHTPYYSGVGLGAFQNSGSQPERLAIMREEWASAR
ncbi:MAG: sigma-70 family RNA polymerase sigma factor [Lawsonibacter sp.]|nr:sigma-70 family RNA polymerase sigma factor [Lawsonibacter sp.]